MVSGTDAAMGRVVEQWRAMRAEQGDDVLIITRRNADATTLNRAVREALRSEGRLVGDDLVLRSIDREKKQVDLHLALGDVVRFGQTLPDLQIWNGNRGTIEAIRVRKRKEAVLRVRLEDGRVVEQPWSCFARKLPGLPLQPPRMVHAYAGTAYSVQGRTAAASVHYVGAGTDAREIYVALTRHGRDVRIVVERDRLDAACRLRQADRRVAPTAVDLEERLFREASQYSEKSNVVDFVADRQAFIATGVVTRPEIRPDRSVTRLMQAARALRDAIRDLTRVELAVPAWRLVEDGIRRLAPLPARLRDAILRARQQTAVRQDRAPARDHGIER